jgi:beta-lactamase family protein
MDYQQLATCNVQLANANTTAPRQVIFEFGRRPFWRRIQTQGHRGALMRITWYGHAAFLVETRGLRIILDPYRSPDSGVLGHAVKQSEAAITSLLSS